VGKFFRSLEPSHISFIRNQHVFFTASAPSDPARVNVSPKGGNCLAVLDDRRIAYYDIPGSGNETANHLRDNGRLTLMWCAFEGNPLILRAYLRASVVDRDDPRFEELMAMHWPEARIDLVRQVFLGEVEAVQTSCGFGVPLFAYEGDRDLLEKSIAKKADAGLLPEYLERNSVRNDAKCPVG